MQQFSELAYEIMSEYPHTMTAKETTSGEATSPDDPSSDNTDILYFLGGIEFPNMETFFGLIQAAGLTIEIQEPY